MPWWPTFITESCQWELYYTKCNPRRQKTLVSHHSCENPALQKLILAKNRSANRVVPYDKDITDDAGWPTFITESCQWELYYTKCNPRRQKTLVSHHSCENPALQKLILAQNRSANRVVPYDKGITDDAGWPTFITESCQWELYYTKCNPRRQKTLVSHHSCENPALQKLILAQNRAANRVVPYDNRT